MKRLCVACVLVCAFVATLYGANQFGPWAAPVPFGVSGCGGAAIDITPAISKDGRSFYFTSACPGPFGGYDLYVAQWDDSAGAWGPPVNLLALNSVLNDQGPAFSRDEHYLYFVSNRGGSNDIWVSYREQIHDDFGWQPPVPVAEVNSPQNDGGPALFQDKAGQQHMILQSLRPGGAGLADLYSSDLIDGTWTAPVRIPELSSTAQEQRATIRFDGLEVIFESNRSGNYDLWVSTRATVTSAWSDPVPLPFNTPVFDEFPYFSADGTTLYFTSTRDGVQRIWVTTRERGNARD